MHSAMQATQKRSYATQPSAKFDANAEKSNSQTQTQSKPEVDLTKPLFGINANATGSGYGGSQHFQRNEPIGLLDFLSTCKQHLQQGGIIIVKENNSSLTEDIFDETDSSVTRTHQKFKDLFAQAGLRLLLTSVQKGLPRELYPVRLYALAPAFK
ncbi:hypothetical protein FF38_04537 [Lucilia cuprina]|uniref:Alpha N-terminal protein methyltransferase 1 n=1 Tax=Lucilia cuprina TaxID=7375 RepID=A0A0L0BT88_LUCCU|nr:hypothetical protein FF38_04537 [Lucilia cuprina]